MQFFDLLLFPNTYNIAVQLGKPESGALGCSIVRIGSRMAEVEGDT